MWHEWRNLIRAGLAAAVLGSLAGGGAGCQQDPPPKPYGIERQMAYPGMRAKVWAVAPAIDLSSEPSVDPLLQADDLYQQLQEVYGLTVIPVNRVAQVYSGLGIAKVQTPAQAALVCDLLGADALIVPTITAYDPYDPPKVGISLQVFHKPPGYSRPDNMNPRDLARMTAPLPYASLPAPGSIEQAVGMFDAANGSVRNAVHRFAVGRQDPNGPLSERTYYLEMDQYCQFAYYELIGQLLSQQNGQM